MVTRIEIPNTVWIRIKKNPADRARLGQDVDEEILYNKYKIGSGIGQNGYPIRGLTPDEEIKFLPSILGLTNKSENWMRVVNDYWANFGKVIPTDDEGLKIEAGMWYESQEDADKAMAEEATEKRKIEEAKVRNVRYVEKFTVRASLGTPLNIGDYILYRHCLIYSEVANVPEDMDKSPKIRFYLFSKQKDTANKAISLEARRKAYIKYSESVAVPSTKGALIYLLRSDIDRYNRENPKKILTVSSEIEKDLTLEAIAVTYPEKFLSVVDDPMLLQKAFIERAIDAGEIRRLTNTEILYYGDNTKLGNNVVEAINFLSESQHADIFNTIKARINQKEQVDAALSTVENPTPVNPVNKFQPPVSVVEEVDSSIPDVDAGEPAFVDSTGGIDSID